MSLAHYSGPDRDAIAVEDAAVETGAADPGVIEFPCSIGQERFWLLDCLHPGNPALNIAVRWQLDGLVVAERVERAFAAILARHEILRTSFAAGPGPASDGSPLQRVAPRVAFRVNCVDLTGLDDDRRPAEAERLGRLEAATAFDLSCPPLLRVTLLRLAERRTLLLLTVHHLVCDGWSIGILAREFGYHYDRLGHAGVPGLPELSIQYGDYALWQRERHRRGEFRPELDYWARQLAGLPYLEVPADLPHRPEAASGGDIVAVRLEPPLAEALQQLSRRQGNTLFVTVLAALGVVLQRYTGRSDFAIGTQIAGRDEAEVADMVGVFINTLVLRMELSGKPSFTALLARVQEVVQGALDHPGLPMEPLIQRLQPRRDLTRNPLFSVNFIFQRSFVRNRQQDGFSLADLPSHSPGGLYDLNVFMVERPDGWRLSCEYDTGLFLAETVQHLLDALHTLLVAVAHDPERPIAMLPLLDEPERQRLDRFGCGPVAAYPLTRPLQGLFEAQAQGTPRSVALVQGARQLSYAQLDRAANRLARYLSRQGVVPGTRVGLLLEGGIDRVVALLAVLKAGGVAVELDRNPTRLPQIQPHQTRLPLILTQRPRPELFAANPVARAERVIALDAAAVAVAREATDRLEIDIPDGQAACVVFARTDPGADPQPVTLSHPTLVNLLCSLAARPGLAADDTLLAIDPPDGGPGGGITLAEWLLPLSVGARLVLAEAGDLVGDEARLALLRRSHATALQAPPALWRRLLDAGWSGRPTLKMLCCCGGGGNNDRLDRRLADRLLATGGELWSLHGTAATGIWSSVAHIQPGRGRPGLGQPIANTGLHVLDPDGQLLPVGAIGALHATGPGIRHATGDLARRGDDGRLERLGTVGQRTQRHGFRIELADIEDEILLHPGITAARVEIGPDGTLGARVLPAAHPSGLAGSLPALAESLRLRLARNLPRYMLPDSITLQPTTDADDAEPPAPATGVPVAATAVPAASPPPDEDLQARLLQIWSRLLGRDDITPTDDFFDLGGHSLLAARLLATLTREFGRTISFATLFRGPTIHDLAIILEQDEAVANENQVVKIQPAGKLAPVFAIDHSWIYDQLARKLGSDRPFFALLAQPADSAQESSLPTLQQMAADQIRILRRQQPRGPYVLLGLCTAGVLAYEIAQQLQDQGEPVPLLIMIDTWSPGYLARQSAVAARLADWSYRWQSLRSDFRRDTHRSVSEKLGFGMIRLREFVGKRIQGALTTRAVMLDNGGDIDPIQRLNAAARLSTQRPFTGRICLFHRDTMPTGRFLDPQLGWADFAAGGIETYSLPGDHFSMFRDPGVTTMAEVIDRILKAEQV